MVKAKSGQLMEPLKTDMADDEIYVSGDSIHILKHHGSYMQQDRSLKGMAKKESYQFMLRLKMPCGEVPGPLYAELDDISNKWGHGDLRATTRQAFQLHGVLKGNLKSVIAAIANIGSNTYGGCGDISRNVMTPPVHFPNNPAYVYCNQYARAMAELFKPMTQAFYEIWLDGKPAKDTEYWQRDIGPDDLGVDLQKVRVEDRGNGIITGHKVEPLYGRTYLPKNVVQDRLHRAGRQWRRSLHQRHWRGCDYGAGWQDVGRVQHCCRRRDGPYAQGRADVCARGAGRIWASRRRSISSRR